MHRLKPHIFLFVLFLFFPLLATGQDNVLSKIADIEGLLDSTVSPWRLKIGDTVQAEKPDLNDSSWEDTGKSWRVDSRVFWVRHDFIVPHAFSGVLTEGSPLHLVCRFRGFGRTEGRETEGIVEFFRIPEKVYDLNLMEERLQPLSAEGKRITLHFGPSEIKTVELEY